MTMMASVNFNFFEKKIGQKWPIFTFDRPERLTMSFSGVAITGAFAQNLTKNLISIFSNFLYLFFW